MYMYIYIYIYIYIHKAHTLCKPCPTVACSVTESRTRLQYLSMVICMTTNVVEHGAAGLEMMRPNTQREVAYGRSL